jgi:TPR repeat protein
MAETTKETIKKALCNDTNAQYEIGYWFYENKIIKSACFWVKRAAQQGHVEAALLLEKMTCNKT